MKFADWKDIAELVGIVTIVASLLFVGLQLKQSHEIALATQYQSRAEATQNLHLASIEADWIAPIPALRNQVSDSMSARDINVFLWLWIQFDNHYYQYQSGFLEESAWQAQVRNIKELYSHCNARFVYEWRKKGLRSEFVELVELGEDPCPLSD
jgi:hypothetical protein